MLRLVTAEVLVELLKAETPSWVRLRGKFPSREDEVISAEGHSSRNDMLSPRLIVWYSKFIPPPSLIAFSEIFLGNFFSESPNGLQVVAGSLDHQQLERGSQQVRVEDIKIHESYKQGGKF